MAQAMGGMIRWHSGDCIGDFIQGEGKDYKIFSSQNLSVGLKLTLWLRYGQDVIQV